MSQAHHRRGDHYYVSAKLAVFPFIAFVAFWPSCFLKNLKVTVFVGVSVPINLLLLLLTKRIRYLHFTYCNISEKYNMLSELGIFVLYITGLLSVAYSVYEIPIPQIIPCCLQRGLRFVRL